MKSKSSFSSDSKIIEEFGKELEHEGIMESSSSENEEFDDDNDEDDGFGNEPNQNVDSSSENYECFDEN